MSQNILTLDDSSGDEENPDKTVKFDVSVKEEDVQVEVAPPKKNKGMNLEFEGNVREMGGFMKLLNAQVGKGKKQKTQRVYWKQERVVLRMQAWARGYLARKDVRTRKLKGIEWGRNQNAMKIQRWWRRYLHTVEMKRQRKSMSGAAKMGLFGPMKVRMIGKKWLRKTRDRSRP